MMNMKKVKTVIIGGGVQGTALGLRFLDEDFRDFIIVDPQPLMAEWKRNISAQGIFSLRTPFTAHLDPSNDPESMLINLQTGRPLKGIDPTTPAHADLFTKHSLRLINRAGLEKYRVPGQAKSVQFLAGSSFPFGQWKVTVMVRGQSTIFIADEVVCAVGLGKPWMPDLCVSHPKLIHSHFVDINQLPYGNNFCVVGSGLTAATLAAEISETGAHVYLCGRSQMSVQQLETDPGWRPGERLQRNFLGISSPQEKIRQLKAARALNVVTPDVWDRVSNRIDQDSIKIRTGVSVEGIEINGLDQPTLDENAHDMIIFATGYKIGISTLPMLKSIEPKLDKIEDLPILSDNFESSLPGLFFMGKLGEMAGGPLMRNIPGARYASMKIVEEIL